MFMRRILTTLTVLLAFVVASYAQREISGKIADEKGNALIGASVTETGTNNGTITDENGMFSLQVSPGAKSLEVSYIGYSERTIQLGVSNTVEVVLSEGVVLSETVVTALGLNRNKSDVVYANQTVANSELNNITNRSVLNALQGKVAGVKIGQASGAVGSSTRVVLRGEASLTQGNNALVIVDGVPLNNASVSAGGGTGKNGDRDNYVDFGNRANDINPDDIESVTVLKGPAATSLYGSRGASGVLLVTTKKGRFGKDMKPRVSLSSSYSREKVYLVMKQQDKFGSGYASCNGCGGGTEIFMGENFGWGAPLDGRLIPWTAAPVFEDEDGHLINLPLSNGKIEQLSRPYSAVKNNLQNFFDIGQTNRNNISLEGGGENLAYFISFTNFNNTGVVPSTNYYKNNILMNVSAKLSSKLTSSFSFNYAKINQRGATEGGYPFGYASGTPAYSFALQTPINIPLNELRDYNSPYHDFNGFYAQYSINPYYILDNQVLRNSVDNLIASTELVYAFTEKLKLKGRVSTNFSNSNVTENNPVFRYNRALSWSDGVLSDFNSARDNGSLGGYKESATKLIDLNYDLIGSYDTKLSEDFKLGVVAGFNSIEQQGRSVAASTVGGLIVPGFYDLSNSAETPRGASSNFKYRLYGVYANASIGYKDWLFGEVSARNDWSSTLPKGNRGFFYQAGGVSVILSNLFDLKIPNLSLLKLRTNIGTSGKDAPRYRLNSYYDFNPLLVDLGDDYQIRFPFGSIPGATKLSRIGNPDLKPELSTTYEFGADLGFFGDRVLLEYTYYIMDSKNQIVDVNIPWSSGYSVVPLNIGRMENKGNELALKVTLLQKNDFNLKVFGSYSNNKNIVKTIIENDNPHDELNIYSGLVHFAGHGTLNMVAAEGQPFGTFKGTNFVYQDGKLVADGTGNTKQSSSLEYLGSTQPKFLANFGTSLNWKGLGFNFLLEGRKGGLFFSGSKLSTEFNGTASTTLLNNRQPFVLENTVTQDDNGNYVTNTRETSAYNYFKGLPAAAYLVDGSYLKLREVAVSYTLPTSVYRGNFFKGITFSLYGKNLMYWLPSANTFADPEVGGVGGNSDANGIETSSTPSQRSYGIEVRLKF
jgi:TonB-linked SusC/RagA family outer membrane protein